MTDFTIGDKVVYRMTKNGNTKHDGRTGTITGFVKFDGSRANVKWDDGKLAPNEPFLQNLRKVNTVAEFNVGDKVENVSKKGFFRGKKGIVKAVRNTTCTVKWDDVKPHYNYSTGSWVNSEGSFPKTSLKNLSAGKVAKTNDFKIGDKVKVVKREAGLGAFIGDTGVVLSAHSGSDSVMVKWDKNGLKSGWVYKRQFEKIVDTNTTPAVNTVAIDVKALAKAYFTGDTKAVENLLKPHYVKPLPVGAVLAAEPLRLVWVVTDKGVMSVDTRTGTSVKSDKSLEDFTKYAEENGVVVRLDKLS